MQITVKYYGIPLGDLVTGCTQMRVPLHTRVGQLLAMVGENLTAPEREFLYETALMVNHTMADLSTELQPGDELVIMHILGGG